MSLPTRWLVAPLLLLIGLLASPISAADRSYGYTFGTHAAFFSAETNQPAVIDPQVFVADPAASAGTGPQNIPHVAGYRPARVASDAPSSALYTAQGRPLNLTLARWLAPTGDGTIVCTGDSGAALNQFRGLVPNGVYQLFRNRFTPEGPRRSPFGRPDGLDSIFVAGANGTATITSALPFCPDPTDGVLLSYYSDGTIHGPLGGDSGVNTHNQLLVRVAAAQPPRMASLGTSFVRRLGDG